ncbi:lysozyme [Sphingobium sufflavum]|uniref:lysozyme n=1 Tax=Sphingobium sufflavum TaxID=1129547 RepID=UPI001F279D97|nr:lysozyme [Sphingobium sufflavum]MCE7798825.1 lysozyme [Sphingobium sufflavum]
MKAPSPTGVAAGGALLVAALSLATPQIMRWEGKRNTPYRDMVGVLTVCHGETQAVMRRYSDAECAAMLHRRAEADYARPILACVPGLGARPRPFAAAISLAYNIGTAAFCRSTTARRFRAGDWAGGCEAMLAWNRAGGRAVTGLARRRAAERALCLSAEPAG